MQTPHPQIVRDAIAAGMLKKDLAKAANLNRNSIIKIMEPDWNPTWDTLVALCDAVDKLQRKKAKASA